MSVRYQNDLIGHDKSKQKSMGSFAASAYATAVITIIPLLTIVPKPIDLNIFTGFLFKVYRSLLYEISKSVFLLHFSEIVSVIARSILFIKTTRNNFRSICRSMISMKSKYHKKFKRISVNYHIKLSFVYYVPLCIAVLFSLID